MIIAHLPAGAIAWGWRLSNAAHPLGVVPATQNHWVLSFVLHWTFLVVIGLCLLAAIVFRTQRRSGGA